jgi:hypothetical protein
MNWITEQQFQAQSLSYQMKQLQEQEFESIKKLSLGYQMKQLQEQEFESIKKLSLGYQIKQLQEQEREVLLKTSLLACLDDQYYQDFIESIEEIESLIKLSTEKEHLKQKLNKLLFANVITAMEAYLADAFINVTINSNDLLRKAIRNIKELKDKRLKLDEVNYLLDDSQKSAKEYFLEIIKNILIDIVYHNIWKLKEIYKQVLDIEFQETTTKEIESYVKIRHHIIHRNGKDKEGNILEITNEDILNLIALVKGFVKDIEQKINLSNLSEEERYPLRGSVTHYEAPTEPVAMEDGDVLK